MTEPERHFVPTAAARTDIRVVNSRFVASAAPAADVSAAKALIAQVRAEMPDATHHVHAYIIGHGATKTEGATDDGEPAGTAGRPVLAILRGSGLGDVVLVVTRYFGGTLLGVGGLVRAYGDAARAVLEILPREEKIARQVVLITVPYPAFEIARRLLIAHAGSILGEEFAADVTIEALLPRAEVAGLTAALREATSGQAQVVEV